MKAYIFPQGNLYAFFVARDEENRRTLAYGDLTNAYNPGMRLYAASGDYVLQTGLRIWKFFSGGDRNYSV